MILGHFHIVPPRYLLSQQDALYWLAQAHARSEQRLNEMQHATGDVDFLDRITRLFQRYGCSSDRIKTRGVAIPDFEHSEWETMQLFSLLGRPEGPTMSERSDRYQTITRDVCAHMYPEHALPPDHLIHVTCTGYVSPSCAQELVVRQNWHDRTVVTHAYHMGCNAALPAIRMAEGFLAVPPPPPRENAGHSKTGRVDILHTEICSLHFQPGNHSPEQIVVQSLFADGFIRYSAFKSPVELGEKTCGLKVEALCEQLIPATLDAITWDCSEWGMRMGLSRDVPALLADTLAPFVGELCRRGHRSFAELQHQAVFAVHPGGPKILDQVREVFQLSEEQLRWSRFVLRHSGNMSSATLPHIWEKIVNDPTIPVGTQVISLAFGPGLCVSGALALKTAGNEP